MKTIKEVLMILGALFVAWVVLACYEAIQASGGLHIVAGH